MSSTASIIHPAGPMKLPVGSSDFDELIRDKYTFVDKSLMIRDLVEDGAKVNLITRPRRFGKTLNLSMLHHFFASEVRGQPTAELFDGLAISWDAASMAHQGQYPVIFFTFKNIKERRFESAVTKLRAAIATLYLGYSELADSPYLETEQKAKITAFRAEKADPAELGNAFKRLCEYLYLHYKKTVLMLIDEYDTPIHAAYSNGYYREMADLMRDMLGEALKDNSYLYKAVVTGILRVSKESLFSGLNNLEVRTVLDKPYSRYFGFTEAEVTELARECGVEGISEPIQSWYNGYRFGETTVYNPWSIIGCLTRQGEMRSYWVNTSDNALLKELMARADGRFKRQMEQLIQQGSIEQLIDPNIVFGDLNKSAMALWSLLLFSGYLTATQTDYDDTGRVTVQINIPNREVLGLYKRHIEEWFSDTMGIEGYREFLDTLTRGRLEIFETLLQRYLLESASVFDTKGYEPERFYHGFVLGLIVGLRETHVILSNQESGFGCYDIAILPREKSSAERPGILMEFKSVKKREQLDKEAEAALAQIDRRRYRAGLEQYNIQHILSIGLAFSGKEVAIRYAT